MGETREAQEGGRGGVGERREAQDNYNQLIITDS